MNKKLLLMYGLFLGWAEVLLNLVFASQNLEQTYILYIILPLVYLLFLLLRHRIFDIEKLNITKATGLCIALMLTYFILMPIMPGPISYALSIILLISLFLMTILMFINFKHYNNKVITLSQSIQAVAMILFVNTSVTLVYEVISHLNIYLVNGVMLSLLLWVYYWYFFNDKALKNPTKSMVDIKVPKGLLLLLIGLMFLFSLGYGPFFCNIRGNVVDHYIYGYIYIRLAYLLALGIIYKFFTKKCDYLEFIMMVFTAIIIIIYLLLSLLSAQTGILILCLIIQFSYAIIHSILGGLVVLTGYLYTDTYKNISLLLLAAFLGVILGNIVPNVLIGGISLNILVTIISFVFAMVLIMLLQKEMLADFTLAIESLEEKKLKIKRTQEIEHYDTLTAREKEVMEYLVLELTNKAIADKLSISENTLKRHAKNIYSKLYIKNKRELKELVK